MSVIKTEHNTTIKICNLFVGKTVSMFLIDVTIDSLVLFDFN